MTEAGADIAVRTQGLSWRHDESRLPLRVRPDHPRRPRRPAGSPRRLAGRRRTGRAVDCRGLPSAAHRRRHHAQQGRGDGRAQPARTRRGDGALQLPRHGRLGRAVRSRRWRNRRPARSGAMGARTAAGHAAVAGRLQLRRLRIAARHRRPATGCAGLDRTARRPLGFRRDRAADQAAIPGSLERSRP